MLKDRNVTNSGQRLLCVTASISRHTDPSKNCPAADCCPGTHSVSVSVSISVNATRVASPPTTYTQTTADDLLLRRWRHAAATVIGGS